MRQRNWLEDSSVTVWFLCANVIGWKTLLWQFDFYAPYSYLLTVMTLLCGEEINSTKPRWKRVFVCVFLLSFVFSPALHNIYFMCLWHIEWQEEHPACRKYSSAISKVFLLETWSNLEWTGKIGRIKKTKRCVWWLCITESLSLPTSWLILASVSNCATVTSVWGLCTHGRRCQSAVVSRCFETIMDCKVLWCCTSRNLPPRWLHSKWYLIQYYSYFNVMRHVTSAKNWWSVSTVYMKSNEKSNDRWQKYTADVHKCVDIKVYGGLSFHYVGAGYDLGSCAVV